MSLIVEVYVGSHLDKDRRELIAEGVLHNITNLSDISDYEGILIEKGAPHLGVESRKKMIYISDHPRKQSVWELIKKMAQCHDQ